LGLPSATLQVPALSLIGLAATATPEVSVVIERVALEPPPAGVTVNGNVATPPWLILRMTSAPAVGAGALV
jgi:hypothetical protein